MMKPLIIQQARQIIFSVLLCMALVSCVHQPVFETEQHALVKASHPIVEVDGNMIEKNYQLDLEEGKHSIVVIYNTYQYEYFCAFSWFAKAGTVYEITDQENLYPLTLYRWHRENDYWSKRLDVINPYRCTKKAK